MNFRVTILPRAKQQLYECALWWAQHRSVQQAEAWLSEIEAAIESIANDPHRYPLAGESAALDFRLQQLNFGLSNRLTHRVLFSVKEDNIVIYAVRHLAQADIPLDELF